MTICRHFGTCGGCSYQEMPDDAYRALKRSFVVDALARHGFADADVRDVVEVPPGTRRRASFKAAKRDGKVLIGFHSAQSHAIVDMHECLVLTPQLFGIVVPMRELFGTLLKDGGEAEIHATDIDTGIDLAFRWQRKLDTAMTTEIVQWAQRYGVARITSNGEIAAEFAAPTVMLGKARVALPPESFLQATREGENALQNAMRDAIGKAKSVVDLFAGLGTFTFILAEKARVHAVEQDKKTLAALVDAARNTQGLKPITIETRDLFKIPLSGNELTPFDAVVLDPPRAGALAQARALAESKVKRIAYISCNADTFARDARTLVDGGYKMGAVVPVDQFLWSSHIELAASFRRS
jgi:23S rRNA (uracil1939-C5)-methyltransferase